MASYGVQWLADLDTRGKGNCPGKLGSKGWDRAAATPECPKGRSKSQHLRSVIQRALETACRPASRPSQDYCFKFTASGLQNLLDYHLVKRVTSNSGFGCGLK